MIGTCEKSLMSRRFFGSDRTSESIGDIETMFIGTGNSGMSAGVCKATSIMPSEFIVNSATQRKFLEYVIGIVFLSNCFKMMSSWFRSITDQVSPIAIQISGTPSNANVLENCI